MIYIVIEASASQGIGSGSIAGIFATKEEALAKAKESKADTSSVEAWDTRENNEWFCYWNADVPNKAWGG